MDLNKEKVDKVSKLSLLVIKLLRVAVQATLCNRRGELMERRHATWISNTERSQYLTPGVGYVTPGVRRLHPWSTKTLTLEYGDSTHGVRQLNPCKYDVNPWSTTT